MAQTLIGDRLVFPTSRDTGYRVGYESVNGRIGWTVFAYEGARSRLVPGVGIVSKQMAQLVAVRLSL